MTLSIARGFLSLPFVYRCKALRELKLLNEKELFALCRGNHEVAMGYYKLAFSRAKDNKQIALLEHKIAELTNA